MRKITIIGALLLTSFAGFAKDSDDNTSITNNVNPVQTQENNNEQNNSQTNTQTNSQSNNQTSTNTNTNSNSNVVGSSTSSASGGTGGSVNNDIKINGGVSFVNPNIEGETIDGVTLPVPSFGVGVTGVNGNAGVSVGLTIPITSDTTKDALKAASLKQQYSIQEVRIKTIRACIDLQKEGYTTAECTATLRAANVAKLK